MTLSYLHFHVLVYEINRCSIRQKKVRIRQKFYCIRTIKNSLRENMMSSTSNSDVTYVEFDIVYVIYLNTLRRNVEHSTWTLYVDSCHSSTYTVYVNRIRTYMITYLSYYTYKDDNITRWGARNQSSSDVDSSFTMKRRLTGDSELRWSEDMAERFDCDLKRGFS